MDVLLLSSGHISYNIIGADRQQGNMASFFPSLVKTVMRKVFLLHSLQQAEMMVTLEQ